MNKEQEELAVNILATEILFRKLRTSGKTIIHRYTVVGTKP